MPDASTNPPDAELLRQFVRTRDDLAFGRLMARHGRAVRRIAYRFTQSHPAADDVTQAAFLVLLKRPRPALRSAKRRGSLLPWLAQVARYAAANWRRAEALRHRRERAAPPRSAHYDPATPSAELAEAMRSALACLSRRDRRIVELRHLSQMPWDQVARHAGTTPEAARKAGTRALSELRIVLEKRGITAGSTAVLAGLRAMTVPATSSAAAVTTITTPTQIAQGVLTMFKVQTAAVTTAVLLATAGLVTSAAALWQDEPPVATQPATQAGPLVVRLSDGTTVTVLALGDRSGRWWTPDGKATAPPEGVPDRLFDVEDGQNQVAVALEVSNGTLGLEAIRYESDAPVGYVSRTWPPGDNLNLFFRTLAIQDPMERITFSLEVPVGEPRMIGQFPSHAGGRARTPGGGEVVVSRVGERPSRSGQVETFVSLFAGFEPTKEHFTVSLDVNGTMVEGRLDPPSNFESGMLNYGFEHLPILEIETIHVSSRQFETASFNNLPAVAPQDAPLPARRVGPEPLLLGKAVQFENVPLTEALARVAEAAGVRVQVVENGFTTAQLRTPVSVNLERGKDVGEALREVLAVLGESAATVVRAPAPKHFLILASNAPD